MARKSSPPAPAYSKFQQWCDAGKPYWSGVGLANQVSGYPTLKKTLNTRESPYNRQKLEGFLREHMSMVPAAELKAEDLQKVEADEAVHTSRKAQPKAAPAVLSPTAKVVKLKGGKPVIIDNEVSKLGPNIPAAWSESKLVLPEFNELPDVLKKGRIESTEHRRIASMLHSQLADGIEDPVLRSDVCAEIVQRMDLVSAHYDLERDWKLHDRVPDLPEDMRTKLEAMDLYELKELITNSLSPRVSRWRKACKVRDGDNLVEAKLSLAQAESEKVLAMDVLRRKQVAHRVAMEQLDRERDAKRKRT